MTAADAMPWRGIRRNQREVSRAKGGRAKWSSGIAGEWYRGRVGLEDQHGLWRSWRRHADTTKTVTRANREMVGATTRSGMRSNKRCDQGCINVRPNGAQNRKLPRL